MKNRIYTHRGKYLLLLGLLVLIAGTTQASPALAAGPGDPPPQSQSPRDGKILGMVPLRVKGTRLAGSSSGNLTYHGGPVEHTNTNYAIYWIPAGYSVSANYVSLINRYLTDVAAASGSATNVYYSDTQYYDNVSGNILYSSSFNATNNTYLDTNPFPPSGCKDRYTPICLSDAQIQSEIQRVIALKGWSKGTNAEFFLFTPKNVGSCAGRSCAYTNYCAYHSWIGGGSTAILYANQPYGAWSNGLYTCDSGQHPNGDDADATINLVSHEQNETITDQQGNAWYDGSGAENGDKCSWNFGAALGSTSAGQYNQVINNNPYYLQQEWSNSTTRCVLQGY